MELNLSGKRALISGGSRGIGRTTAEILGREGVRVALLARGAEDLAEAVSSLREAGAEAIPITADVTDPAAARRAVAEAQDALGGLDIVINNAGGSLGSGGFDQVDDDHFRRVMALNLDAAVVVSRAALGALERSASPVIVHVSSICGIEYCSSSPYTVAKGAIGALTKSMAIDLAKKRIRVVAVAPGSILFPGGSWDKRHTTHPERITQMLENELPYGRFGTPEEVANAIVFLCSERASWITGTTLVVDGGQSRAID